MRRHQEPLPKRTRGKWLALTMVVAIPLIIFCLFFFHFIVSAGAAGGCGGG
jgi:ABC-type glycerol-3-phosphate transport system permease component